MSEEPLRERPKRRPRYTGKNPRGFAQKYKEHQPERYPEAVAKVLASGKTPAGTHRPIMVREILEVLRLAPGDVVVDCTLGYGGHAQELLAAVQPGGKLIALDQDPLELPKTEARLRTLGFPPETLLVRRMNYAGLSAVIATEAPRGADAVLADLGLSSMQIDDPARGFTFKMDAPLDMRMNPQRGMPAAVVMSKATAPQIATWLRDYGDEPHADMLAEAMVRTRPQTTRAFADLIRTVLTGLSQRVAPEEVETSIRRIFQAVRIVVNDEFSALEMWLRNLPLCLKPGGRVAVLTFHSGEDRRVKQAFKTGVLDGSYSAVSDTVIRASPAEQHANPRSSPAKLRWAIRA